jgi:hypothetical protein
MGFQPVDFKTRTKSSKHKVAAVVKGHESQQKLDK